MISILTPMRGRPWATHRFLESIYDTTENREQVEVISRIDDNDEKMLQFVNEYREFLPVRTRFIIGKSTFPNISAMFEECYQVAEGNIFFMAGDDLVFKTKSWDIKIESVFKDTYPDKIACVWGDDKMFGPQLATHNFVHRKWIETIGHYTCPMGMTYHNDNWIHDIARRVNRLHYISDLIIEHVREKGDPNYGRMEQFFHESERVYNSVEAVRMREEAANKLSEVINHG